MLSQSSEPGPDQAATFNRHDVWQLFDGDAGEICELLLLVVRDVPLYVTDLLERVRADDMAAVARLGHKIRGAVGNIGAATVGEIASAIEHCAREGEAAAMPALCAALENANAALMSDLDVWVRELKAAHVRESEVR
jgi:HPt (histidine-containing phosphotransfer) domain-containing protein